MFFDKTKEDRSMKCPKCGDELRRSKKDPNYGLCDNCRLKFKWVEDDYDDYEEYVEEKPSIKSIEEKKSFFSQVVDDAEKHRNSVKERKEKKNSNILSCPKCKGHNIDLWSDTANMKVKQKTTINLNPLKPFTIFETKTVQKEKKSAAKVGLAIMTGGTSALITGTKKKNHNEYYCRDCGHRWIGK